MTAAAAVIPAYNEARTLRDVAERCLRQVPLVIVVDDGSTDATRAAIAGLPLTLLVNARNLGKGESLLRGMRHALSQGVEAIVTLDGDGQHVPEDIPQLLAAHARNCNALVVGSRLRERDKIPRDRYVAQRVGDFCISWAARRPIEDSQCGYRVYPANLFRSIEVKSDRKGGFVFESEILIDAARAGFEIVSVPIGAIYEPRARRSHFRPLPDFCLVGAMVAGKIIARGFDVPALLRILRSAALRSR